MTKKNELFAALSLVICGCCPQLIPIAQAQNETSHSDNVHAHSGQQILEASLSAMGGREAWKDFCAIEVVGSQHGGNEKDQTGLDWSDLRTGKGWSHRRSSNGDSAKSVHWTEGDKVKVRLKNKDREGRAPEGPTVFLLHAPALALLAMLESDQYSYMTAESPDSDILRVIFRTALGAC